MPEYSCLSVVRAAGDCDLDGCCLGIGIFIKNGRKGYPDCGVIGSGILSAKRFIITD